MSSSKSSLRLSVRKLASTNLAMQAYLTPLLDLSWDKTAASSRLGSTFRIPETEHDWQIYHMPESAEAAKEMAVAMKHACAEFVRHAHGLKYVTDSWGELDEEKENQPIFAVATHAMKPVWALMSKWRSVGAMDTEPRFVARSTMARCIRTHFMLHNDELDVITDNI